MSFVDRLRMNAYSALDVSDHVVDIHGWTDGEFAGVIQRAVMDRDRSQPLTVIEVGSWKGLSSSTMASLLKRMGFTQVSIICIDTWLGAPEFWTWGIDDPTRGGSLNLVNGYPSVFTTFAKNMKKLGHDDVIAPFPISSIQAVDVLRHYNISADVIYIDAAHEYEPVKQDIKAYWALLRKGGTMMGDDYMTNWPGVMKAVNELISNPTRNGVVWSAFKANDS